MAKERSKSVQERIEKAVEIIKYAIKNQVSVKEASVRCGFSDTYVKNIKAMVYQKFGDGDLNINLYNMFNIPYQNYISMKEKPSSIISVDEIYEPNKPKDLPKSGYRESFREKGNDAEFEWIGGSNYPKDHVHTLNQLLGACNVDSDIWKVKDHIINKWDVTMKLVEDGEWVAKTFQNWQVKARLERDIQYVRERIIGELFQQMVADYKPPIYNIIPKTLHEIVTPLKKIEKNLLEISIFDLHIGKLAWGGETFENYDVKIARKRFLDSLKKLLDNASGFDYERILFPAGNDFFNSDTIFNTTTKGTQQDEDLRWQKTFNVGVKLLVDGINLLKQTGVPVDVVVIPGNHDFERSFYMGAYLEAWFSQDPLVHINNGASPRKYYRYGNLLLGLTHGSEEKESSLPMLMATDVESKPMWSETKFHEWHIGHIHRKKTVQYDINKSRLLNEDLGVTIRYLSSLTGTEEWHHKKGFVGSTKAADGFVWNHEFGLIAHLNTNLILN
jgi:hypothetical protein